MLDRARFETWAYTALRFIAGFLFLFHGAQKLLGVFATRPPPEVFSQIWFGGIIELVGGTLIALGLFTRPAAFISAGEMAVAYIQFHWKGAFGASFFPINNKGELAVLFCFLFLFISVRGPGPISIDRQLGRA
ncbi:MAG TPA: DoxX family protein [Kofleriaceae bacterium]|nr:DoxX family protein [Kofleriaceae bacterium]